MAKMTFTTTNLTSQAQAIIDALEDVLAQHDAYSKMATVNSADSGQPCSVWKSSGAYNELRRDYYILVMRESTNPSACYLGVAEGFDQANRAVLRPAPGSLSATSLPAEDFSFSGARPCPIWDVNSRNSQDIHWVEISGSANRNVWCLAANDTVTIIHSVANATAGSVVHLGVGEPFRGDDPGIVYITTDAAAGFCTRHPTINTVHPRNWEVASLNDSRSDWTPTSGKVNGGGDRLHNNRPVAARKVVAHTGEGHQTGTLRGLHNNVIKVDVDTSSSADLLWPGEQMFADPDRYIYPGTQPGRSWFSLTAP